MIPKTFFPSRKDTIPTIKPLKANKTKRKSKTIFIIRPRCVITKIIQQDLADAKTLNVRKTPGFFVNGKPLPSFGYKQLQELVESEINAYY